MNKLSHSHKPLIPSERLFPLAVLGLDLGLWLLIVPGKLLGAL
jgi:hypothetical protein